MDPQHWYFQFVQFTYPWESPAAICEEEDELDEEFERDAMAVIMAVDDRAVSITVNYVITNRVSCIVAILCQPRRLFCTWQAGSCRNYQEYFRPCRAERKKTCCFPNNFNLYFTTVLSLLYLLVVRCGWQWQQTKLGSETPSTLFDFFHPRTEDPETEVRNPSSSGSSRPHAHVRTDPPHPL